MAKKTPKPGRTLAAFFIVVALLYGGAAATGTWKPQLGLDLEGGTRITLTAQGSPSQTNMNLARNIVEQRANGSGVTEAQSRIQAGRNIVVEIPGENASSIVDTVSRTAQLRFRLVAAAQPPAQQQGQQSPSANPSGAPSGGASGAPSTGASGAPTAQPSGQPTANPASPSGGATGNNRPGALMADKTPSPKPSGSPGTERTPQVSTASPSGAASQGAGGSGGSGGEPATVTQALAFQDQPSQAAIAQFTTFQCPTGKATQKPVNDSPNAPLVTCDRDGNKYLLSPTVIEGTQLSSASYGTPDRGTGWAVQLGFKKQGRDTFADVTKKLAGTQKTFAIVLDGRVLSAPQVTTPILDGNAQITGDFTQSSARSLSNSLKYGALPVKFDQPTKEVIGPSLAGDQLQAGVIAGIVGLVIVMIYCLLYYRGLGLVVIASLVVAAAITYAVVLLLAKTASFTLTLPGIAGLIVAVGITADSFIVYFERIRDEMRTGKSMRVAVELGWARARNTCLAADAVSLLAALVLYIFTIGVVKGFAFALGVSTIIDVAVFFWFTKPAMTALARRKFFNSGGSLSGLSKESLGVDGATPGPSRPARRPATVGGRS